MNPVIGAPLKLSTILFYRRGNWGLERMNNSLRVTQSAPSRTWTLVHQSLKIVFYPHHHLPYYWFHYIILFPSSNMYYLQIQWFLLAMFQFSLIKYKSYVPICQFIWRSKQDVKITLSLPLKKKKKKKRVSTDTSNTPAKVQWPDLAVPIGAPWWYSLNVLESWVLCSRSQHSWRGACLRLTQGGWRPLPTIWWACCLVKCWERSGFFYFYGQKLSFKWFFPVIQENTHTHKPSTVIKQPRAPLHVPLAMV